MMMMMMMMMMISARKVELSRVQKSLRYVAVKHGDKVKRPANSAQNQYVSHGIFFGTCHSHDLHLLLGGWIATF